MTSDGDSGEEVDGDVASENGGGDVTDDPTPAGQRTRDDRSPAWLSISRYEAAGRRRGTVTLTALLSTFVLVFLAFFPSFTASGVDLDEYVQAFPPAVREMFGIISIASVEGFLAVEFYQFAWLLLVGLYLAYLGGETIAADLERRRMDLTLAAPVRRREVVAGKVLGLVPLALVLNVVLPVVTYLGVRGIGETIAVERLVVVHALAIPYHLACLAIGVLASVLFGRARVAQRVAIGVVFGLFMFESLTALTEYDWLGVVSPTAHYDPSAILVRAEYDWVGGAVLVAVTVAVVAAATYRFERMDLTG